MLWIHLLCRMYKQWNAIAFLPKESACLWQLLQLLVDSLQWHFMPFQQSSIIHSSFNDDQNTSIPLSKCVRFCLVKFFWAIRWNSVFHLSHGDVTNWKVLDNLLRNLPQNSNNRSAVHYCHPECFGSSNWVEMVSGMSKTVAWRSVVVSRSCMTIYCCMCCWIYFVRIFLPIDTFFPIYKHGTLQSLQE